MMIHRHVALEVAGLLGHMPAVALVGFLLGTGVEAIGLVELCRQTRARGEG